MPRALATAFAVLLELPAGAQYVPPVLKGLAGETEVARLAVPLPRPGQEWIRAASPNFQIISSAPEKRTREIAEMLESVSGALRRVNPRFDARFGDTTVYLFSRRSDSQPYFELLLNQKKTNAAGTFVSHADGTAAIIIDARGTLSTDRTVKHELMHNILATSGTRLPLWLEEGIAEYFSTTVIRGDKVITGRPILQHQRVLRLRGVLPMRDVLAAQTGSPVAAHALFYPLSWALVDWMMRSNRRAFYPFVADIEAGLPAAQAFERHYSMTPDAVARSIRSLAVRPSASTATAVPRRDVPVVTAQISYTDALCELARFLGQMESTRDDAERFLNAALTSDPAHARAAAGIGGLRARDRRYDDAVAWYEKALAMDPDDPVIQTGLAETLLENAIGLFAGSLDLEATARPRFVRARELATAALKTEATPLREALVGTTYLVEDDASPAIVHLERALAARPARLDFALNLYAAYLASDRGAEAEQLFETVFAKSRNPQAAYAARAVYVRDFLTRANRHIAAGRIDEAAVMIGEAISATVDPSAKADLERQLAGIRAIADANRVIMAYNDAVLAYNRRENREALQLLDALLAGPVEETIRGKAERLRESVRKRLAGM